MPCYHGQIIECDFFEHYQYTRFYRIVKRSPAVRIEDLKKLRAVIDQIMQAELPPETPVRKTIKQALAEEEQRHRKALHDIIQDHKEQ